MCSAPVVCVLSGGPGRLRCQAAVQLRLGLPSRHPHGPHMAAWRGCMHACMHLAVPAEWVAQILCLQVGYQMTTEAAKRSVDPLPSLSGYTVAVWFRVCCEQLQVGSARAVPH